MEKGRHTAGNDKIGLEITGETQALVWAFECLEFMSLSSGIAFIQVIQNRMRWGISLTRRETLPRKRQIVDTMDIAETPVLRISAKDFEWWVFETDPPRLQL